MSGGSIEGGPQMDGQNGKGPVKFPDALLNGRARPYCAPSWLGVVVRS